MGEAESDALPDTAVFVQELYEQARYETWADFARDAGVLPSSLSNWKRGKITLEGPNLLKLIRAVQRRDPAAFGAAAAATTPAHDEAIARELAAVKEELAEINRSPLDVLDADERALWNDSLINGEFQAPELLEEDQLDYLRATYGFDSLEDLGVAIDDLTTKIRKHPDNARLIELRRLEADAMKARATREPPTESDADSPSVRSLDRRLAGLEAREAEMRDLLTRGFEALGVVLEPQVAQQPDEARPKGRQRKAGAKRR